MRSKISDKARLGHIIDAIELIEKAMTDKTKVDYDADFILQAALQRFVQIIGEAAYKLSEELKMKNVDVDWKAIAGIRHIMVHEYFGIDMERIWEVIEYDVPKLKLSIVQVYNEL